MTIINGNLISEQIQQEIAVEVSAIVSKGGKKPHLAAILVGNDGASETYVGAKVKACEKVGFDSTLIRLPATASEEDVLAALGSLNNDDTIDGYIVQLPLPKHISEERVVDKIDYKKDVDGFHTISVGRMTLGLNTYLPATPSGILELLKRYNIETTGKQCVVIGRSQIVGSTMSILMSQNRAQGNATVTLCHSKTKNIKEYTLKADIIIVAIGKPNFLTADMVKEGAVVIDVGITRIASDKTKSGYKLIGDVMYDEVAPKTSYITPVPGGVGPMTIASLLLNTLKASKKEVYQ